MANKRQKKKDLKKKQATLLEQAGYSRKEQARLDPQIRQKEIKRLERNQRERDRIAGNRRYLLNQGVPLSIITKERLDRKARKHYTPDAIQGYKQKARDLDRQRATKNKRKTETKKGAKKGSTYIYVGFSEYTGFNVPPISNFTTSELEREINEMIADAADSPDKYDRMKGFFRFYVGSKSDCELAADTYYNKDYQFTGDHIKLDRESYSKVTISNTFTKKDFLHMVYTCISQMKNEQVKEAMSYFRKFDRANGFNFLENIK